MRRFDICRFSPTSQLLLTISPGPLAAPRPCEGPAPDGGTRFSKLDLWHFGCPEELVTKKVSWLRGDIDTRYVMVQ